MECNVPWLTTRRAINGSGLIVFLKKLSNLIVPSAYLVVVSCFVCC